MLEQPQCKFDPQDAPHGIIDAVLRNIYFGDCLLHHADEGQIIGMARLGWHHGHINSGIDRGDHGGVIIRIDLVDWQPKSETINPLKPSSS